MFPSIDELMKAQAEAFKTTNSVATTAFDGARKLLELNVQAARAGMEESSAQLKALLAAGMSAPSTPCWPTCSRSSPGRKATRPPPT